MVVLQGKGVCGGIVSGPLCLYRRGQTAVVRRHIDDTAAERKRLDQAREEAIRQLGDLYEKALGEVGEQGAMLFEIHQMMLEDADYCDSIGNIITQQRVNAEYAVAVTGDNFARMFAEMDDPYMKERAADVKDISERLVHVLLGRGQSGITAAAPAIIGADDLAPSETVQMDKANILSFVTAGGSVNSHTAILARTMGIPAVIGVGGSLMDAPDGVTVIVDGHTGTVYIDPDQETAARMQQKQAQEKEQLALLQKLKGKRNRTTDGRELLVYANIGSLSDLGAVFQNDAGGIGLFRTEFLYLESSTYPTEEQQFAVYKSVAETMAGKRVIFRTLDIGADKQAAYFELPREENPAMGMRALRICLTRPDIFKTQMRALYRASAYGRVAIMFPMVASLWEVQQAKQLAAQVRQELHAEGIAFRDDVEVGIMIETPAAAVISDRLAPEVDFFSIGTNDLSQYTMAVDRQNESIHRFFDPHHEAVLRLISLVVENAHKAGIWAGICGELAADLTLTKTFVEMGVDELSVSPSVVLPLRAEIRSI